MILLTLLGLLFFPSKDRNQDLARTMMFRAGSVATIFPSSISSLSGEFSWNPRMYQLGPVGVVGNTGVALLFPPEGPVFLAPETEILFSVMLVDQLALEAGAGVQYWLNSGINVYPEVSSHLVFTFDQRRLGALDALVLGYSHIFQSSPVHEIKLMVEFAL